MEAQFGQFPRHFRILFYDLQILFIAFEFLDAWVGRVELCRRQLCLNRHLCTLISHGLRDVEVATTLMYFVNARQLRSHLAAHYLEILTLLVSV